jgi:hypothetical protein
VKVKGGTFIPAPADKKLAKEITDKNAEIKKLKIRIETWESRFQRLDEYWKTRDDKITKFYEEDNKRLKQELIDRDNWWERWGKVTIVSLASATVAAFITYEVVK